MVLFVLYEILTLEYIDKILWCYHSNETSLAVLSDGTICFVRNFNFGVYRQNSMVLPFK